MYTSVMLVALSGSVVASYAAQDLAWQTDYAQARARADRAGRARGDSQAVSAPGGADAWRGG